MTEDHIGFRPIQLADFIGQERLKKLIWSWTDKSKFYDAVMDHTLFKGLPGYGKSQLARIMANERGVGFHGPLVGKTCRIESLQDILEHVDRGDVVFIDEIHGTNVEVLDWLNIVLTEFKYIKNIYDMNNVITIRVNVKPFTLVGATTDPGKLTKKSAPFIKRFRNQEELERYSEEDIVKIVLKNAEYFKYKIDTEGAIEIAKRSNFTPRTAIQFLKKIDDYSWIWEREHRIPIIDRKIFDKGLVLEGFKFHRIDDIGLGEDHKKYLNFLVHMKGGPIGLNNIAKGIEKEEITVEQEIEPPLTVLRFIKRGPKGREITEAGLKYLGVEKKDVLVVHKKKDIGIGGRYRYGDDDILQLPKKK